MAAIQTKLIQRLLAPLLALTSIAACATATQGTPHPAADIETTTQTSS